MKTNLRKFSFESLLLRFINRGLMTASVVILLGMTAITISWIWSVNRGIERLVRTYAEGVVDYALNTSELLSIQRDLNHLHKGIFDAFGTKTYINLTLDGTLLGQTYDPPSPSLFISKNNYNFVSSGSRRIGLETRIDHTSVVWRAILMMIGLQILVFATGIIWQASARRSLRRISLQLSDAVVFTERMVEQLSQDNSPQPLSDSDVVEISKLLSSMNLMSQQVVQLQKELRKAEFGRGQIALATQVAHDIRSPLAALFIMEDQMGAVSEEKRQLFRRAIGRVREIADSLLEKKKQLDPENQISFQSTEKKSKESVGPLLGSILYEKKIEWQKHTGLKLSIDINSSEDLVSEIQPIEFKRLISNLLNNAAESLNKMTGEIHVSAAQNSNQIEISIQDQGKGIPRDLIPKLMRKGATFGKENGSGLGLYHAKVCVENWGGTISIHSEAGLGTTLTLKLPSAAQV